MSLVAGVDFGTLSVRVSIVDSERGLLASAIAEYPLHRKREDPDFATQSHEDHMRALAEATRQAVKSAGIAGDQVLRRRVFLGVGIRQAPALAAAQSRQADAICKRVRALRYGRGHAVRNH